MRSRYVGSTAEALLSFIVYLLYLLELGAYLRALEIEGV